MKKPTPKPKAPRPRIVLVRTDSRQLTLGMFRDDENLVSQWQFLAGQPVMQAMLQVMRNEAPAHWLHDLPTGDEKILQLGRIQGYEMALNNLEALASLVKPAAPLVATFENPNHNPQHEEET